MTFFKEQVICITGMERSGTSLVARIMNLLGVYLGPQTNLLLETDYNPKGCWEHLPILEINEQILLRFGGGTHNIPSLPSAWQESPELSDLRAQARTIIESDFRGQALWGWKDTRNCITMPFWQSLLPEMRYVICVRNPLDVVNSLIKRKWLTSIPRAMDLWLSYTSAAIKNTSGRKRVFVFYEDVLADPRAEAQYLEAFLERSEVRPGNSAQTVLDFTEKELHHYRSSLMDALQGYDLTFPIKALYLVLRTFVNLKHEHPDSRNGADAMIDEAVNVFSLSCLDSQRRLKLQQHLSLNHKSRNSRSRKEINQ